MVSPIAKGDNPVQRTGDLVPLSPCLVPFDECYGVLRFLTFLGRFRGMGKKYGEGLKFVHCRLARGTGLDRTLRPRTGPRTNLLR